MEITQALLKELLHYDSETGIFTWKNCPKHDRNGMRAGSRRHNGYISIMVEQHAVMAHRLAFLYMTGSMPPNHVDHINLDKADNRWENLRLATKSENGANSRQRCKSGLKGAYYNAKCNCWYSKIGKKYLGAFKTPEEANAAFLLAARENYGEFARG